MVIFPFSHSVFKRPFLQTQKNQGLFGKGVLYWHSTFRLNMLIDFLLVIIPLQLILTWLNSIVLYCYVVTFLGTLLLAVTDMQTKSAGQVTKNLSLKDIPMTNRRAFVTYYRAFTNLLTAFSILAIDFKIFPRYLGKTETYGTGLMDVGVGCFLIANAIVSPEARQKSSSERYDIHDVFCRSFTLFAVFFNLLRTTFQRIWLKIFWNHYTI